MAERTSALDGHVTPGRFGAAGETGVTLSEIPDLVLHQVAAWPDSLAAAGAKAATAAGVVDAPGPCAAVTGSKGDLLRIEPLKWWLVGTAAPALSPEEGATLDLSHSRCRVRLSGPQAVTLLNRHPAARPAPGVFPGRIGRFERLPSRRRHALAIGKGLRAIPAARLRLGFVGGAAGGRGSVRGGSGLGRRFVPARHRCNVGVTNPEGASGWRD